MGQKKRAPSLYLQQVAVARGKVVSEGVTTRRPPQRRPTSATARPPAKAGRTRPKSRREPRSQAPAAGRSAPAPRPSPPPDSARACALQASGAARVCEREAEVRSAGGRRRAERERRKRRGTVPSAAAPDRGGWRVGRSPGRPGNRSTHASVGSPSRSEGKAKPRGREGGRKKWVWEETDRFPEGAGLMARALDSKS